MDKAQPKKIEILIAFACVYIIWGSTYLGIRIAIEAMPPFFMAGSRFIISSLILYILASIKGENKIKAAHWKDSYIIGGCMLLGGNGGVVWAEQFVPSGLAALLVATVPIWMVMFDWLNPHGKRPTRRIISGIVLGFTGVAIMISPAEIVGTKGINLFGALALLISTLSWAYGSIYSRRANLPKSKILTVSMEMFAGGTLLLLISVLAGEFKNLNFNDFTMRAVSAWVYLITFGSVIGFTAYIWLLDAAGPSRTSTYAYVNPVIAVFLGWIVLGEPLNIRILSAMLVIVLAVFFIISKLNFKDYILLLKNAFK